MVKRLKFQHLMIAPTIIILACLTLFPLIYTLVYSFTDYYYLASGSKNFVGFDNYIDILNNELFRKAVMNTIKFMFLAVLTETTLGLLMALVLNSLKKGVKILRVILLLPTLLPPVTVALTWQMMFSNNDGIINQLLSFFNIGPFNWLLDVSTAFYSILIIDIWQWTPFAFLLIYASLQSVPQSQYEAAVIDGANELEKFVYITLPNILPGIFLVILLRTIDAFRLFDKVNILTKGGPANSTTTITQYIYLNGIYNLKVGYGAAAALIMALLVLLFSVVYLKKVFGVNEN